MQCASAPWDIMRICDFSLLLSRFLCTVSNIYYSYNFRNSGSSGLSKPLKEEPVIDYFDVQDWSHWCRITAQKLTGEDNKSLQKVLLVTCQMSAWPTYPWFNIWGWIAILYLSALYLTVVPFFFFFESWVVIVQNDVNFHQCLESERKLSNRLFWVIGIIILTDLFWCISWSLKWTRNNLLKTLMGIFKKHFLMLLIHFHVTVVNLGIWVTLLCARKYET